MTECLYKSIETAKNGTLIPVFQNGKTMESRYNPERDAENLCNNIDTDARFFLVLGIGSGLFIKKLHEKYKDSFILGLETSDSDILFLKQIENVKYLSQLPNVRLESKASLYKALIENYLPAKYGDLKVIEQRAWLQENLSSLEQIKSDINKAAGIISADYSVQAHFGKVWQKNILNNSRLAEKTEKEKVIISEKERNKTAVIFAAGPGLEKQIQKYSDKSKYYLIATDTAFSILNKKKLKADCVISIDGQNISYNHFLHNINTTSDSSKTLFYFDLCANSCIANKLFNHKENLHFFFSGHPLAAAINNCGANFLPYFFSGAGTVTITAVDFAVKNGFKNIHIAGADFGYLKGKAYSYGTYLDNLYNKTSSRLISSEFNFDKRMFRTPLKKIKNKYTTEVLEAYRFSLEKYLSDYNISFIIEDDIYILNNPNKYHAPVKSKNFDYNVFIEKIKNASFEEIEVLLLPYIAWLRNNAAYKSKNYEELLKLAFNSIVSYNI